MNFDNISFGMNYNLTDEEWECVRVCVSNAPIPYDITKKKIPASILDKIGQPTPLRWGQTWPQLWARTETFQTCSSGTSLRCSRGSDARLAD